MASRVSVLGSGLVVIYFGYLIVQFTFILLDLLVLEIGCCLVVSFLFEVLLFKDFMF